MIEKDVKEVFENLENKRQEREESMNCGVEAVFKEKQQNKYRCNACSEVFDSVDEQKLHYKSEWHWYNLRRKAEGLNAVSLFLFKRKLQQFASPCVVKGRAHLKSEALKCKNICASGGTAVKKSLEARKMPQSSTKTSYPTPTSYLPPFTPFQRHKYNVLHSLFDNACFNSLEDNIKYMKQKYSFFLYDEEYLTDKKGFIHYLGKEIYKYNKCIYCNKYFCGIIATQHHMRAKGHTFMSSSLDEETLLDIQSFYDYTSSYTKLLTEIAKKKNIKNVPVILDENTVESSLHNAETIHSSSFTAAEDNEADWEDLKNQDVKECEKKTTKNTQKTEKCALAIQNQAINILSSLGIRKAEITVSGDLRLPNGKEVVSRHVAYVYKQRLPIYRKKSLSNLKLLKKNENFDPYKNFHINRRHLPCSFVSPRHDYLRFSRHNTLCNFQPLQLQLGLKANNLKRTINRKTKYFL